MVKSWNRNLRLRQAARLGGWAVLWILGAAGALAAQQVELVSRIDPSRPSVTPDGNSSFSDLNADGRYVVFTSTAINVVPEQKDTNNGTDVFLRDQVAGTTVLVSRASGSASSAGNAPASGAQISANGRYVLFRSKATNLVSGQVDPPGTSDLFLFDRVTGATTLVSHSNASARQTGNADSIGEAMNAEGRFVLFSSLATDLVKGQSDANSGRDVFLFDRISNATVLVSRAAGTTTRTGNSDSDFVFPYSVSSDGTQLLFLSSARDLLPGGTTGDRYQLFLFNRSTGLTTLVSHVLGSAMNGVTFGVHEAALSADGNYAAFTSAGDHLVPEVAEVRINKHLYLYHRPSAAVTLVTDANSQSEAAAPRLSADGRFVAFTSGGDVVLYDRTSATRTPVTRSAPGNAFVHSPSISADGRFVVFTNPAKDLVPGQIDEDNTWDLFLYDRDSRTIRLVNHTAGSSATATGNATGEISVDGRFVGFTSPSGELAEGGRDFNRAADAFLYARTSDSNTLISLREGTAALSSGFSQVQALSADGRYVLFRSTAPNLVPGQRDVNDSAPFTPNDNFDLFLYDRTAKTTTLVSRSAASSATTGNGPSRAAVLSADDRWALFISKATDLVPGQNDDNKGWDLFLFDRAAGAVALVSHNAASPTATGNGGCSSPASASLSADGQLVAFSCLATDLVPGQNDGNSQADVFLYDRSSGNTILVSHAAGSATTAGDGYSDTPSLSTDGRFLAFLSSSTNLVPGQRAESPWAQLFLFDRVSGTTTLVTHVPSSPTTSRGRPADHPWISPDGSYIAFDSESLLVPGVSTGGTFLFERLSGQLTFVGEGSPTGLSADGRFVTFRSVANDVIPGQVDRNQREDTFLYDRVTGTTQLVSRGAGPTTAAGGDGSALSADGSAVAFSASAADVQGFLFQPLRTENVFVFRRATETMELISRAFEPPLRPGNGGSYGPVLSADGQIVAFESDATDLISGDTGHARNVFLYSSGGSTPGPSTPCTLLDTHRAADAPALQSDVRRVVTATGACGVPSTAKSITAKVTVLQGTGKGNLRIFPGNAKPSAQPSATLRFEKGQNRTASYTLPLATNGAGTLALVPFVAGKGTVHVVVEITGAQ